MVRRSPALCAMTSQAGNITGNSHVKVSLRSLPVIASIKGKKRYSKTIQVPTLIYMWGVDDETTY